MDKEELAVFIGNKIKEFRLLKNMTQSDLADLLKTTKQTKKPCGRLSTRFKYFIVSIMHLHYTRYDHNRLYQYLQH